MEGRIAAGTPLAAGPEDEQNKRVSPRANLLLPASVEAGGVALPVLIRNLSETGAAIEGARLPAVGARVILRRLDLAITGVAAWTSGSRCGLHFDGKTSVGHWISGTRAPIEQSEGQSRIDAIQAAIRTGSGCLPAPRPDQPQAVTEDLDTRLSEELVLVRAILDEIGEALTDEPIVIARHMRALQGFDLAAQILGHVSASLIAEDRAGAVAAIGMEDLRARLLRDPEKR